jgi:hypothetical protein
MNFTIHSSMSNQMPRVKFAHSFNGNIEKKLQAINEMEQIFNMIEAAVTVK